MVLSIWASIPRSSSLSGSSSSISSTSARLCSIADSVSPPPSASASAAAMLLLLACCCCDGGGICGPIETASSLDGFTPPVGPMEGPIAGGFSSTTALGRLLKSPPPSPYGSDSSPEGLSLLACKPSSHVRMMVAHVGVCCGVSIGMHPTPSHHLFISTRPLSAVGP